MPFSYSARSLFWLTAPVALALLLGGCDGKKEATDLANLDTQLIGNGVDPALQAAVEDRITVDPDLVAQSNRNAIRPPDKPFSGAVPGLPGRTPTNEEVVRLAGGALMQAPAATTGDDEPLSDETITLGGVARMQKAGGKGRHCPPVTLRYAHDWAMRLPATFPLYPGAQLREAAGAGNGLCGLRAVSFVTGAAVPDVLNFYYTLAHRAGYSAERQTHNGQEILGGARDEAAYFLVLAPVRGGGAIVDLIVNGGR